MPSDTITVAPDLPCFAPPAALPDSNAGISTVIVDSIAGDTISGRIPHFIPASVADSIRMAKSCQTTSTAPALPSGADEGLSPQGERPTPDGGTPVVALLIGSIVLTALNYRRVAHALRTYRHELWSVRQRPNVFDDGNSVPVSGAALLQLLFIIFGGIVLYFLPGRPAQPGIGGMAASMCLTGLYSTFLYISYSLVGYAFTDTTNRRRWLSGFMATQAYTGLLLIIPALLLLVEPHWRYTLVTISLSIYFAGRILFIARGMRIFNAGYKSLLYFILYLCSVEIIPLLVVYRLNTYLWLYTT